MGKKGIKYFAFLKEIIYIDYMTLVYKCIYILLNIIYIFDLNFFCWSFHIAVLIL